MTVLLQDLGYALRQGTSHPGFALTSILMLALGMGMSVALFGFVDAALLQPLPYEPPERLMSVNESNVESPCWPLSYPDYLDWQRLNKSLSSLDVYSETGCLLRTPSGAVPVQGERVSGPLLQNSGCASHARAGFLSGRESTRRTKCCCPELWGMAPSLQRRARSGGQTVDLDNVAYTIIGVLLRTSSSARAGDAESWFPSMLRAITNR